MVFVGSRQGMAVKYLKPMLDAGSSRVFNCNALTRKLVAKDPEARRFFRNPPLNACVLIKDAVPESERKGSRCPPVGTKLYFPFNERDIYEGGRTIFLHDPLLSRSMVENFGQSAELSKDALAEDLRVLGVLDELPSLDPFLMKDALDGAQIAVNEAYFEISPEQWKEIELFILQRFEPLVQAAFPDAMASDEKARRLVATIWEAKDVAALRPLIEAFRLPADQALAIFAAWKGINFYSYQYSLVQPKLVDMAKWLRATEVAVGTVPHEERAKLLAMLAAVPDQLRRDWQTVDGILREYTEAYDQMFRHHQNATQLTAFLRNSAKTYWDLGSGLGKLNHATYCRHILTGRYGAAKLPVPLIEQMLKLLMEIFQQEKKQVATAVWG